MALRPRYLAFAAAWRIPPCHPQLLNDAIATNKVLHFPTAAVKKIQPHEVRIIDFRHDLVWRNGANRRPWQMPAFHPTGKVD
jgi:hypothetical protein